MDVTNNVTEATLISEIKLQINQKLLESGLISKEMYELAIARIVSEHTGGKMCFIHPLWPSPKAGA